MIRVTIISVGKQKKGPLTEAAHELKVRLGPYMKVDEKVVAEVPFRSVSERKRVLSQEAEALKRAMPQDAVIVVLEATGKTFSSERFTELIWELSEQETRHLVFVLGGPLGLSDELKASADLLLSFSPMTVPHDLARVILLEQLYRAATIRTGKTYHY